MKSSSETTTITGGGQANKTGGTLELFIKRLLEDNGYTPLLSREIRYSQIESQSEASNTQRKCHAVQASMKALASVIFYDEQ